MKTARKKNAPRRRNAAPATPRRAPRRRRIPLPPIPDPPDWKTTAASVLGGGGSALIGGYLANRGWDQQMVGLAMTTGGAVGAFALPGPWRVAANGIAASGAGQFALATVHKAAVNKAKQELVAGGPKRNALPSAFSDALARSVQDYSGASYAGSLDDEERMLDPDLVLEAASKRTKKPLAADTHRNVLAQVKSFLAWCVERGWLRENPCAEIKGIGKRRPRGKSLGKEGKTLRVKEARAWYEKAVDLADGGDEGATAALVALLLGMRASEIVSRKVSDLDEDSAPGDLLWIPCSKTPAGRRTLEVPDVLRPLLVACAEGKAPESYIFETEDGKAHWRDWIIHNVHRICDLAKVPRVTAHAMRGLLATITAERGMAGHLIAATLGHEDERTTMHSYAAPGAAAAGVNRRGLTVLQGGVRDK